MLGHAAEVPSSQPLAIEAVVSSDSAVDSDQWRVLIRTRSPDARGEREIREISCARLARAAAVVIALAIDPNAGEEREPDLTAEATVRVAGGATFGVLPTTSPAAELGAGVRFVLRPARLRIALEAIGRYSIRQQESIAGIASASAAFEEGGGGLRACVGAPLAAFGADLCATGMLGVLSATGIGVPDAETASPFYATVGLDLVLEWRFREWLALELGGGAGVAPTRTTFALRGFPQPVYETSLLVGHVSLGFEASFP